MRILFVSSELSPLAKTGGLGEVLGALPQAIQALGHDVRIIMPLYKSIKDHYFNQLTFLRWSMLKLGWRTIYSGLFSLDVNGITVYFIDNEYFFGYDQLYLEYSFDIERFSFFQRAVLEAIGKPIDFEPDILHLNDWQTGMIPVVLEAHYKKKGYHKQVQCLYTIHNLKYQGIHGKERIQDLFDLPDKYMTEQTVLHEGVPNFMKAGIVFSNRITTVSPSYADEIKNEYYGEGLNYVLDGVGWKLSGILNGIDEEVYNPKTDPAIDYPYSMHNWRKGKKACKEAILKELKLNADGNKPLAIMITRLVSQKGLDLLLHVIDEMIDSGILLVVLGTGDQGYEIALKEAEKRHKDGLAVCIEFNDQFSHRLYAAGDMFLMPSIFEPCGLAQMVAMRYGTVPIVREVGGLKDTVQGYGKTDTAANGFSFANINAHDFLFACKDAAKLYQKDKGSFGKIVRQGMSGDFSWEKSALKYESLYKEIIKETRKRK